MESIDWDKGLPPDVLALVAKAGGLSAMKDMRGVSKTWQEGFELGVTGIRVSPLDPVLPDGGIACRRFPMLTMLDVGDSSADEAWLQTLRAFPKLSSLVLGYSKPLASHKSLARRLSDTGLALLHGLPLVHLDLSHCTQLTPRGIRSAIRGMPLTSLILHGVGKVTDAGMESLRGMPLRVLDLSVGDNHIDQSDHITDEGLACLRGAPLESLDLAAYPHVPITDAGLAHLRGMPLTRLNLEWCPRLTPAGLEFLRGMPLRVLNLNQCTKLISDSAMEALRGLPLADLSLCCGVDVEGDTEATDLTDAGMAVLAGFPLTSLSLTWCQLVTQTGFEKLRNLRLTRLDITRCNGLTDTGLEAFRGLPLTDLRICSCVGVTDQGLRILVEMSLTKLDLSGSDGELTDACLDHIQGMTSLTWLNISRRTKITDAGLARLKGLPLTSLDLRGCLVVNLNLRYLPLTCLDLS